MEQGTDTARFALAEDASVYLAKDSNEWKEAGQLHQRNQGGRALAGT